MNSFTANKILQKFKREHNDCYFLDDLPSEVDIDDFPHQYGGRHYILHFNERENFVYGYFYDGDDKYSLKLDDNNLKINKNGKIFDWKKLK